MDDDIQEKLQAAAPRNQQLLKILADTEHGKPALAQQKRYIADLQKEIAQLDKRLKDLEACRMKELKDHEKYRDSVLKRFAYKATRKEAKFNEQAEKEEREYFDALQEEHKAKTMRTSIGGTLEEAKQHQRELEEAIKRHKEAQASLDELYDAIFEGPTPGIPNEDRNEVLANEALTSYHNLRESVESENQAVKLLENANKRMELAAYCLDEARSHSRRDMYGGGSLTDMMERNALMKADRALSESLMYFNQARRISPDLQPLPPVEIAEGNLMSDVFFDNVFSDVAFHNKIKESQIQQARAHQNLINQSKAADQRLGVMRESLPQQAKKLEDARSSLQKIREDAFARHTAAQ